MVLKWLTESGGIQVFPPVVVLAQMCVACAIALLHYGTVSLFA